MAKIEFSGLDVYMKQMEKLGRSSREIAEKALYEGAGIVADEIKAGIENLPTDENWGTQANPARGIKKKQKQGLQDSFGISPIQDDNGFINVLAGFDGYNAIKTKKRPKGQPNQMIARVAESGTSFSQKTPFFNQAVRRSKPAAEKKMKETFEQEINDLIK